MHCTPGEGKKRAKESRIKKYEGQRTDDYEPPELQMPDIDPCEHLVDYLFEAGPTTGEHALSWQELNAWCDRTGVDLDEFEATTIISLSKAYLGMLGEGRDVDCPPPHRVEKTAEARRRVAQGLREALHSSAPKSTQKGLRKRENAKS